MNATSFVDTNVLVYSRDANAGDKQVRALAWLERLWKGRSGRLSYQVLNEYYVITTRKLNPFDGGSSSRAGPEWIAGGESV